MSPASLPNLSDKTTPAGPTGPAVLHYVRDALGSVVGRIDAGDPEAQTPVLPALVERYDYDPYGHTYIESGDGLERRTASKYGNPFAWTAQRYDARPRRRRQPVGWLRNAQAVRDTIVRRSSARAFFDVHAIRTHAGC